MPTLYENLETLLAKKDISDITPANIVTVTVLAMQTVEKYFNGTSEEKNIACKLLIKTACERIGVKDSELVAEYLNITVNQVIETVIKATKGEYKINRPSCEKLKGIFKCK